MYSKTYPYNLIWFQRLFNMNASTHRHMNTSAPSLIWMRLLTSKWTRLLACQYERVNYPANERVSSLANMNASTTQ